VSRRAIELRYELLPQIYRVMEGASRTGVPALRPLFLEFPEDRETGAASSGGGGSASCGTTGR
jgi:alpha-glucosidase (family GH31 glycosyl hydrolase)